MANTKKIIKTRLGDREIALDKVLSFPRGLIGFEESHEFILLIIKEDMPFLMLQCVTNPNLGLLVADPFSFVPDYKPKLDASEKKLLQAETLDDLSVLVTVSIPPGKPEETAMNLVGPIFINHAKHVGAQVAQTDGKIPARVLIQTLEVEAEGK